MTGYDISSEPVHRPPRIVRRRGGDEQLPDAAAALRRRERRSTKPVDDADGNPWAALRQALLDMADGKGPTRRDERFALHSRQIEHISRQALSGRRASGLLFDANPPAIS